MSEGKKSKIEFNPREFEQKWSSCAKASADKQSYNPNAIEKHWQDVWEQNKIFSPDLRNAKKPYYNLMMFPYPSAEGLHVGNMYAQTGADIYGRFQRMQGKDVFVPIGLDGFGIHSENYALKVGRHPMEQAKITEKRFYEQMHKIGNSFDWTHTLETYDPEYYRWTQWLFVQMFKNGLAYRKKAEVNWCPGCKTVLSDEQVIDGKCERCNSVVERRELEQWFFRITKYAQKLLDNLEKLDWTEKVKIAQKNWIGRSQGCLINFRVVDLDRQIEVFTTRPDTLFGATFVVLSPEHPVCQEIDQKDVKDYVLKAQNISNDDRIAKGQEKTGVFSGLYAINPVNNEKIPVWIADYVLMGYGTGAIMAVPAHDERDFEFAKKYGLEIKEVIRGVGEREQGEMKEAYAGEGEIINSGNWNGFVVPKEIYKTIDWLEEKDLGKKEVNYHLRDWLISRQRYWGPPIPMVYCSNCADKGECWFSQNQNVCPADWNSTGWYPIPENDLPVLLPNVSDWKPDSTGTGQNSAKGPLANHPEFYKTTCPACGGEAMRETDVSDTFLDSAWYFLRYTSVDIENAPFDTEIVKKWLPVDIYIGGAEHAVLHLLYSRFVTMVLKDLKFVDFDEPFPKLFAHGLIVKDGAKMSKSRGNVVVPDEYINKYGADTLRMYLMFLGPFSQGGDFRDSGVEGIHRFVKRVWKFFIGAQKSGFGDDLSDQSRREMHKAVKKVTEDISQLHYNTAISGMMVWYNFLSSKKEQLSIIEAQAFLKLLAPFAPHMTEELWQQLKGKGERAKGKDIEIQFETSPFTLNPSIHLSSWPAYDEKYLVSSEAIVVIQVNGKRRGEIKIENERLNIKDEIEKKAREVVLRYLEGHEIKKVIHVPGKIINFVV